MRTISLCILLVGCSATDSDTNTSDTDVVPDDPPVTDTDGDGLSDDEEAALGTDPELVDSDGDGYSDFEEHDAGTDPLDTASVIYTGGWPYNPNKDALNDPGWETPGTTGDSVPNFTAYDQYGDLVQLYDFAGRGKPIVLDVGTPWCSPCKALAAYLSTGDMDELVWNDEGDYYPWWSEDYADLRRMIQDEEIYWITVLFSESDSSGPTDQSDCEAWDAAFPNEHIPVLADSDLALHGFLAIESFPAMSVVDSDMKMVVHSPTGPFDAMRYLFPE